MIRLYPQVVQKEKDIQELREHLVQRQVENQEQMNKLTEAAVQIEDLHQQIHTSEQEQDELLLEHGRVCEVTFGLRSTTSTAFEVRSDLTDQLLSSQEEHEEQLRNLAKAESESQKRWVRLQSSGTRSTDLSAELPRLTSSLEELRERRDKSLSARSRLRGDWDEAVQQGAAERGEVRQVTAWMHELRASAALAEERASHISEQTVCSELAASELWQSLARVEGEDHRRDGLHLHLRTMHENEEELRASIQNNELHDRELHASVKESEAQHESAKTKLKLDAGLWKALRLRLQETEDRTATLQTVVLEYQRSFNALAARRSKTEEAGTSRTKNLRTSLEAATTEGQDLEGQAGRLEEESQELQRKVGLAESTKEDLIGALAKKEEVHEELLVKKAELEAELEELKKKFRCTIS